MSNSTRFNKVSPAKVADRSQSGSVQGIRPVDPGQALEFSQLLQRRGESDRSMEIEREARASEEVSRNNTDQPVEQRVVSASFMTMGARSALGLDDDEEAVQTSVEHTTARDDQVFHSQVDVGSTESGLDLQVQKTCEAIYKDWIGQDAAPINKKWKIELMSGDNFNTHLDIECTISGDWVVVVSPDSDQSAGNVVSNSLNNEAESFELDIQKFCSELESNLNEGQFSKRFVIKPES